MAFSFRTRCLLVAPLLIILVGATIGNASARESSTYTISAASGYGVEDCLAEGGECGRVVADAWCQAHGNGAALKFGRAEDNGDSTVGPIETRPFFITCGE